MTDAAPEVPITPALQIFPPMPNPYVVGVATAQIFDDAEVGIVLDDIRRGAVAPLLTQRLVLAVEHANSTYYRFDLKLLDGEDEPVLLPLPAEPVGLGLRREDSTRKLTVVVPMELSPGRSSVQATFPAVDRTEEVGLGTALIFPSFLEVRFGLDPEETFTAVVTHALGPAFR